MFPSIIRRHGNTVLQASTVLLFLLGAACSTDSTTTAGKPATTQERIGGVLNQPLDDLNISGEEIPPLLATTVKAPYAPPAHMECAGLTAEIDALTRLLGPDLMPVTTTDNKPIVNQDSANDAAWDAARSAALGWIPFRGVVRFVTGADRRDARVKHAILAGFVRRAYLNGLAESAHCPAQMPVPARSASGAR